MILKIHHSADSLPGIASSFTIQTYKNKIGLEKERLPQWLPFKVAT